jgi:hypothetical protein
MEDNAKLQGIIMENCPIINAQSPITSLLNVCRTMQTLPRQEGRAKLRGASGLYSKATCFEFHQLLLATLLSYGKTVDEFMAALNATPRNIPGAALPCSGALRIPVYWTTIWQY